MILNAIRALNHLEIKGKSPSEDLSSVSIHSNDIQIGDLFIALIAKRNGHEFIPSAISHGATSILLSEWRDEYNNFLEEVSFFVVPDTHQAMRKMAKWMTQNVITCKKIAITGSYAKTTVKEMTAAVLSQMGVGLVTQGNYNNLLGIPLTILNAQPNHKYALYELGMNRYGEISALTQIANPEIGLITHIGTSHLAFFGSQWGIAQAKHELFDSMAMNAIRLYNIDDEFINDYFIQDMYPNKIGYSLNKNGSQFKQSVLYASKLPPDEQNCYAIEFENVEIRSPLEGEHHMENLLSTAVIAKVMGIPINTIPESIFQMQRSEVRNNVIQIGKVKIIRDEYNASRNSILAGLRLLKQICNERKTIAVLGDVYELGEFSKQEHITIAKDILGTGIDEVYLVGHGMLYAFEYLSKNSDIHIYHSYNPTDWIEQVLLSSQKGSVILVKGSRGMKMEQFSEQLMVELKRDIYDVK